MAALMECFLCGTAFHPDDGVSLGSAVLCSERCSEAVYQMKQRDYPLLPDAEAFAKIRDAAYARRGKKGGAFPP